MNLQSTIQIAQYWKSYQNVLTMLQARGYHVPLNSLSKSFTEFQEIYNQCLDDPLVLHKMSFSVSKDPTKPTSNSFSLPNISNCIGSVLEFNEQKKLNDIEEKENEDETVDSKHNSNICVQVCDAVLQRDVLQIQDTLIPRLESHEVLILFCRKWNRAVGIEPLIQILKYQQLLRSMHMILIINNHTNPHNVLASLPRKLLQTRRFPEQTNNGAIVEWFSLMQTAADITKTVYHARFEKYDKARAQEWLESHHLKAQQLETIRLDDPIAAYHDYRKGDFIAVHDTDNTTSFIVIGNDK